MGFSWLRLERHIFAASGHQSAACLPRSGGYFSLHLVRDDRVVKSAGCVSSRADIGCSCEKLHAIFLAGHIASLTCLTAHTCMQYWLRTDTLVVRTVKHPVVHTAFCSHAQYSDVDGKIWEICTTSRPGTRFTKLLLGLLLRHAPAERVQHGLVAASTVWSLWARGF